MIDIDRAAPPAVTAGAVVPAVPWLAYGYGLLVALTLGHFLLGLPIQLSDSFGQMLKLPGPWSDLLYGEFTQRGYMRPLMWGELKLVYKTCPAGTISRGSGGPMSSRSCS